ncbi:class II aldolase/adducin family protein [Aliiruegeria sabulilitoris]|uniref:class II aldolase/adducin family protein n=1 Tax=Aliiruegeria sabulilitoris TaxID=1510458 RepID=UPI00082D88B8|nr:class II aldolase/adducin family protein [Aliiruegeria sabulilitoris]NDR58705.1 class II aldolase [Pseudoruegeria sp. M32A2M]
MKDLLTDNFRAFSAKIGADPLCIQGPGGNTSIKDDEVMWIKASGFELADAVTSEIFVAVDRNAADAEAHGAGDGTCKATVLDPEVELRPSIETTFHAALNWRVCAHTHSVAALSHVISPDGRKVAKRQLEDLNPVFVPYAKPGLPLTTEILKRAKPESRLFLLENHGLIVCGETTAETDNLMQRVEGRLFRAPAHVVGGAPAGAAMEGFDWAKTENWMARHETVCNWITEGSYYPDHVVFLGAGLPTADKDDEPPVVVIPGEGIQIRKSATSVQRAMLTCLSDIFRRLPKEWEPEAIGHAAEAELLNWDAEKYRQWLAAKG